MISEYEMVNGFPLASPCSVQIHLPGWVGCVGRYTICKVTVMGVSSPKLSILTIVNGIRFMLAPESHKACLDSIFPIVQGMVKLPRSFILIGKLL